MSTIHMLVKRTRTDVLAMVVALLFTAFALAQSDHLPSRIGPRAAIVTFVEEVTKQGSPEFVAEPERVAVFDNDGTLWLKHPMYAQLAFALDRVKTEPFKAVLDDDMKADWKQIFKG